MDWLKSSRSPSFRSFLKNICHQNWQKVWDCHSHDCFTSTVSMGSAPKKSTTFSKPFGQRFNRFFNDIPSFRHNIWYLIWPSLIFFGKEDTVSVFCRIIYRPAYFVFLVLVFTFLWLWTKLKGIKITNSENDFLTYRNDRLIIWTYTCSWFLPDSDDFDHRTPFLDSRELK